MDETVTQLLDAIASGAGVPAALFAEDASVDATVPGWRFALHGAKAISDQYGEWYADAGRYEELDRTALPSGELVRFLLTWTENGIPHAAHQAHILTVDAAGRITRDHVFCGGRWDAGRLAAMEEAASSDG